MDAEEYGIISYECKITANNKLENKLYAEESNQKLFAILVEQCSKAMWSKTEGKKVYEKMEADQDGIALLKLIKKIMIGVEDSLKQTMDIVMAKKNTEYLLAADGYI